MINTRKSKKLDRVLKKVDEIFIVFQLVMKNCVKKRDKSLFGIKRKLLLHSLNKQNLLIPSF